MQGHNVLYSTVSKTPRQIPVPYSEGFLAGPPDWDGAGGGAGSRLAGIARSTPVAA